MSALPASQRIVVTGLGIVSVIGQDVESFFNRACAGQVGISAVRGIAVQAMNSDRGAEIHDFDIAQHFPGREDLQRLGRARQLALAAARQCLEQSGHPLAGQAVGVALGYTQGESKIIEACSSAIAAAALDEYAIEAFADHTPQSVPQQIASEFGLSGPVTTLANACSASGFAIGVAMDALRSRDADAMVVGGADAFSRYGYASFSRLGAIATDVPRPFSAERKGMVPGEGAGMLFLETLESAQRRGATVLAEVIGYGESCDAHHITQPAPRGIVQAARCALASAAIAPQEVSCISAHGTGTQASDQAESAAFLEIFGDMPPPVTALKSMLGHAMGAATAMECVAAICSLQRQVLLPTMNHLGPDPKCPVDCVPNQARPASLSVVLKTASAFGGNNSAVIFRACNGETATQET